MLEAVRKSGALMELTAATAEGMCSVPGVSKLNPPLIPAHRRSPSPPPFVVLPPRRLVNNVAIGRSMRAPVVNRYGAGARRSYPPVSRADRVKFPLQQLYPTKCGSNP